METDTNSGEEQPDLLGQISSALNVHDWAQVLAVCPKLNAEAQAEAHLQCTQAKNEQRAQEMFKQALSAAKEQRDQEALALFRKIPRESVYFDSMQSNKAYQNASDRFYKETIALLNRHVRRSKCVDARASAELITAHLPDASGVDKALGKCAASLKETVAATTEKSDGKGTNGTASNATSAKSGPRKVNDKSN